MRNSKAKQIRIEVAQGAKQRGIPFTNTQYRKAKKIYRSLPVSKRAHFSFLINPLHATNK